MGAWCLTQCLCWRSLIFTTFTRCSDIEVRVQHGVQSGYSGTRTLPSHDYSKRGAWALRGRGVVSRVGPGQLPRTITAQGLRRQDATRVILDAVAPGTPRARDHSVQLRRNRP